MDLSDWRGQIDEIDGEIVKLLRYRTAVAKKIGKMKRTTGTPVVDSDREEKILRAIATKADENLGSESLTAIFREIIRASRAVQTEPPRTRREN